MTILLIGLLAAVGIGGGIAAASGGGGGGGSASVSAPADWVYDKPHNLSVLSNAYTHTASMYDISFSAANTLTFTSVYPAIQNGIFTDDEIDEEVSVSLSLDNYEHSDRYADYFAKDVKTVSGQWYDEPGMTWSYAGKPVLALGGRQAGLSAAEFGYVNDRFEVSNSTGRREIINDIMPLYTYDTTRVMQYITRSDTVHFDGNVLGGMYYGSDDEDLWRDLPLTGSANLDVNFATAQLTGSFDTKVEGKEYHKFNVSGSFYNGQINAYSYPGSGTVGLTVDSTKAVDSSLAYYAFTNNTGNSRSSYFNATLLNGDAGAELVGRGEMMQGDLEVDFSFGAKEYIAPVIVPDTPGGTTGDAPILGGSSTGTGGSTTSSITNLTGLEENLIRKGSFSISSYSYAKDPPVLTIGTDQITWGTSLLEQYNGYSDSDRIESHVDLTFTQSDKDTSKSAAWFDYYEKTSKTAATMNYSIYTGSGTITQVNTLILAGKKLGLTAAEVGMLKETRSGLTGKYVSNGTVYGTHTYDGYSRSGYFYMYDQDRLYNQIRSDRVAFSGHAVFEDRSYADFTMSINFANDSLRGSLSNSSDGKKEADFYGSLYNRNWFDFASETDFLNQGTTCSGAGHLLQGDNGMEAVGNIAVVPEGGGYSDRVEGIFGAKQM